MDKAAHRQGVIFGIQHFSVDDGPGIRTAVFLKGCNMSCVWCHNPESIARGPELMYGDAKCVRCGACVAACPYGVHGVDGQTHTLDRAQCHACGHCAEACLYGALSLAGWTVQAADIVEDAARDARYYRQSGGGLTLTGGEPLCQPGFTQEVARLAKQAGLHVALETNGCAPFEAYEALLPYIDLFLLDYKITDEAVHLAYTGVRRDAVLDNIKRLGDAGAALVLRCPIIPGLNDNTAHFLAIAEWSQYPGVLGYELMPYHKLGTSKAPWLGKTVPAFPVPDAHARKAWNITITALGGREWGLLP